MTLDPLITVVSVLGLGAFTLSGVIEAKRKDMDVVGAAAVAFITAVGGGTMRDVLLGRYPIFWIEDQRYALGIFALAVISFYSLRAARLTSSAILVPDALGLGLFTVTGASYAIASHTSLAIASLLGVITGVLGGVLRDVVCNEIPSVFARTQLYATCAPGSICCLERPASSPMSPFLPARSRRSRSAWPRCASTCACRARARRSPVPRSRGPST